MNNEILITLIIIGFALVSFLTGWLRMDITALLVMFLLFAFNILTPTEALAGFSSPVVVIVWSMFILSGAIYKTGVAKKMGALLMRFNVEKEWQIVLIIMISSASLSTIMSNIGVAALMLPVVMEIARKTDISPSKLLIPLAFSAHMGGLLTMVGTPANLLVSYKLEEAGYQPFHIFDFAPLGLIVMAAGIAFITLLGAKILPDIKKERLQGKKKKKKDYSRSYGIEKSTFSMKISKGSNLIGKKLSESYLRPVLGVSVLSITHKFGHELLNPSPGVILQESDELYVHGNYDLVQSLINLKTTEEKVRQKIISEAVANPYGFFEGFIHDNSELLGKEAKQLSEITQHAQQIIAIKRERTLITEHVPNTILEKGDSLLMFSLHKKDQPTEFEDSSGILRHISKDMLLQKYKIDDYLTIFETIHPSLKSSSEKLVRQIENTFNVIPIGFTDENGSTQLLSTHDDSLSPRFIICFGNRTGLPFKEWLPGLTITEDTKPTEHTLEKDQTIMAEALVSPHSNLIGKTIKELNFRKKYSVNVLSFWREGKAIKTNLHNLPIRYGEVLLLYGNKDKLEILGRDEDFILLTDLKQDDFRTKKSIFAITIIAGVLLGVISGLFPLAMGLILGVVFIVLSGTLKMEEAYRAIDWKSVFLIAGMIPLATAIEQTGTASLAANIAGDLLGAGGPMWVLGGLYIVTLIANLAIHPSVLVLIMGPIVIAAAETAGVSPHSFMIAIAIAASGSYLSPVAHPANLLVMAPGGYRFKDYLKIGLPLSLVSMALVFLTLRLIWPF